MSRLRLLLLVGITLIVLVAGLGACAWWYFFGANEIESAELVPANTLFFASIPDAAELLAGYQTSQAKTLLDSPNAKPLCDAIATTVGTKNIQLIHALLPNLSGQSFFAVTHFDLDHPEQVGLIAAMKPKAGLGDFQAFVDQVKAAYPDIIKQGTTGTGSVEGVNYEWIEGPGSPNKICVAQLHGWIITSWGEASLQDWIERFRKKSTTTSLAHDLDYEKSIVRVGDDPMALLYVNYHSLVELLQKQMDKTNPASGDYLANKLQALGGAAVSTRFENGEIADRFSFLFPRPAQIESGMGMDPCSFETLKFTGPDTRFYLGSSINWKQYYKNLREQSHQTTPVNPMADNAVNFLQNWVHNAGLDTQQNIVDALGSEFSVQVDWTADSTYPEAGLFVKVDKPDDFKPTIAAVISTVRQIYANSAVIQELNVGGQKFASLQFVQSSSISPTMTEEGPYFGVFLTANQAVRSFQRDPSIGLTHNPNFARQVGDKRNGAAQVLYLDSPYLLDRAYRTAMPYLSVAEMFNKSLAAMTAGRNLPPDLGWLAPIGTWSCIFTPDEEGIQGYSVSGIGNQGVVLAAAMGGTASLLQTMGILPKTLGMPGTTYVPGTPPVPSPFNPMAAVPPTVPNSAANIGVAPFPPTPKLPVLADTSTPPAPSPGAIIYITIENKIFFDETPVPPDQIADFLKAKKAANQGLRLTVRVDKDASPDVLSTVMDAGASAGFGVLPYTYTSGDNSLPPPTNSDSAAPPNPNASTNAPPSSTSPSTGTNSPSTTYRSISTVPGQTAATAPLPIGTNPDGTPQTPGPLQPQ
jgi:hypothetical protein